MSVSTPLVPPWAESVDEEVACGCRRSAASAAFRAARSAGIVKKLTRPAWRNWAIALGVWTLRAVALAGRAAKTPNERVNAATVDCVRIFFISPPYVQSAMAAPNPVEHTLSAT